MPIYPEPEHNPQCRCREHPLQAFFCASGHLLECHFPFPCAVAGCSHLHKYDWGEKDVQQMEARAVEALRNGRLTGYRLDDSGCVIPEPLSEPRTVQ